MTTLIDRAFRPVTGSSVCREADFSSDWYRHWISLFEQAAPPLPPEKEAVWGTVWAGMKGKFLHRKLWEWAIIAQALEERGYLTPGKKGIGFAVGEEPLSSLFASKGVTITASDYVSADNRWGDTGQLAASLDAVHWPGLIPRAEFEKRVCFKNIDMRDLSSLPRQAFDFTWSSCSMEHLGTLQAGIDFARTSLQLLRSGGMAIHTTELNLSSNEATTQVGGNVLYRRRDIEELDRALRKDQCGIEALCLEAGTDHHDLAYDTFPFYQSGRQHVKLELDGFICTSIALIIRKA